MTIPLDQIAISPPFSPAYPPPPTRYRGVKIHMVVFRADPAAMDAVLPACFEPSPDGECVARGQDVTWSTSYGAYQSLIVSVKCLYEGQAGYYTLIQLMNGQGSVSAGREIWGTGKVHADVTIGWDERTFVSDARIGGTTVASVRSTLQRPCEPSDLPVLKPAWHLKAIPRADGPGAEVLQLVDVTDAPSDVVVHVSRSGDGVVEFRPSPVFDLTALAPREVLGAYYLEEDHTESYGVIAKDFLRER